MSDQLDDFDHIIREKLGGQEVPPPETVWEGIQAERSYGHVVANRVSNFWQQFGTMMLIILGGSAGLLFGEIEENIDAVIAFYQNENTLDTESQAAETQKAEVKIQSPAKRNYVYQTAETKEADAVDYGRTLEERMPDAELMASIYQAAFSRPTLKDERLQTYVDGLDGWETAKPIGFTHYYQMDKSEIKPFIGAEVEGNPLSAGDVNHEYFKEYFERRTFKDRASIYLAFTPTSIQKVMTPKFNLSTDYLEERAQTENTRLAYTFSAALHYEIRNNRFIETGINVTQIYEEMSFEGEKRFSNQYDFVEIPFLLGYKDRNAKWGWHIKGGFGVQVFNNYKGYILKKIQDPNEPVNPVVQADPGNGEFRIKPTDAVVTIITNNHSLSDKQDRNGVYDLSNEEENPYKSGGVVNFHMAAGITYHHSIKTSFMLSPHYTRNINTLTKGDALFNEHINSMGISLGTLIKF